MGNNKWAMLFFVALMAWQVVSVIIQSAAKKKKQEELQRQMADRRSGAARSPQSTAGQPAAAAAAAKASRVESLELRRKAQLEELRARRQRRQGKTTLRAGGPVAQQVPTMTPKVLRSPPRKKTIRTLDSGMGSWQTQQEAENARQDALRQQVLEQQRLAAQRDKALESARRRRVEQEKAAEAARLERLRGAVGPALDTEVSVSSVRARLADPRSLAQLFVLKELLDPPLALRADADFAEQLGVGV